MALRKATARLQKRKHPYRGTSYGVPVTSIGEIDPIPFTHPAKRQKSETPLELSNGELYQSRDTGETVRKPSTPEPSRVQNGTPVKPPQPWSPWVKKSPYSRSNDQKDFSFLRPSSPGLGSDEDSNTRRPLVDSEQLPFSYTQTTFRKTVTPSRHVEPPKYEISVEIPSSPTSPDLLSKFQIVLPKSQATINSERNALLKELKKDPAIALQRPDEAQRVFGGCFSERFQPEDDEDRMRKLASKKKRTVVRKDVALKLEGESPLPISIEKLGIEEDFIHPAQAAKEILTSRFEEPIHPPLTFANDVNERRLHGKFQFTDRYLIRDGVKMAPATTNFGCECRDCTLASCICFSKEGVERHPEQRSTYTRRADGIVVLSEVYLAQELNPAAKHFEITECNEFCGCGPECWNRVVGKGRTVPLEVFQTLQCGFGVRSSQDIVRGQFIEVYLGEVITEADLRQREDAAEEDEPSYIYSLDWFDTNNDNYHVDGKYFGTAMRFVNHSCNPNARSFTVQIHKRDKKVYYLAFFAIKDIQAGTEIRISYLGGGGVEEHDQDELDAAEANDGELAEDIVRCYCGEQKCRKFLWTPGVKARRRRRRAD